MKTQSTERSATPGLSGFCARPQQDEDDTRLLDELEAIVVQAQLRQEEEMSL